MNIRFNTADLEKYYRTPLEELKGKLPFSEAIISQFQRKVNILLLADSLSEIRSNKGLNLEKLKGDLKDFYSIRLNQQYRIIFKLVEEKGEITIQVIEIYAISKHYE